MHRSSYGPTAPAGREGLLLGDVHSLESPASTAALPGNAAYARGRSTRLSLFLGGALLPRLASCRDAGRRRRGTTLPHPVPTLAPAPVAPEVTRARLKNGGIGARPGGR